MSSVAATKRLRVSIWVGNVPLDDEIVKGGANIVDDVSMLSTIVNVSPKNTIAYEVMINSERTAQEVESCHRHNIQCLAGFSLTSPSKGERTIAFEQFLAGATDASIDAMAKSMVDRMDDATKAGARKATQMFDGISFDNENLDGKNAKDPLVKFYRAVAAAVTKPPGCGGRFVAVAAAPLSSPTMVVLKERLPVGSIGSPASQMMLNHPYEMSAGLDNLVVRPMCYDTFTVVPPTPASTRAQWHADVLDYAVGKGTQNGGTPATRPAVFQMGFKNAMGFHNNPANVGKQDETGGPFRNLDGVVDPGVEMEKVCWEMRKAGVGIALFAFPDYSDTKTKQPKPRKQYLSELESYFARVARYNYVLNGWANADGPDWTQFVEKEPSKNTCTPYPPKQPVQAPIGTDGQARFIKP